jgi:hypothetical protein
MRLALVALGCCSLLPAVVREPGSVATHTAESRRSSPDTDDVGSSALERSENRPVVSSAPTGLTSAGTETGRTVEEQELVSWAYARFELVGMELPSVDISFHDDTDACGGVHGRFRGSGDDRKVLVCVRDAGTFATRLERQRTLVHELAHAWDHANLDDEARRHLLPVVDAHGWYAADADWDERGVERFAETIVWGLYDQLRRPVLIDVSCAELHADFRVITGTTAPGPLERACHSSPSRSDDNPM